MGMKERIAARKKYRGVKKDIKKAEKELYKTDSDEARGYNLYKKTHVDFGDENTAGETRGMNLRKDHEYQLAQAEIDKYNALKKDAIMGGNPGKVKKFQGKLGSTAETQLMNAKYGASVKDKYMKGGSLRNHNRRKQT